MRFIIFLLFLASCSQNEDKQPNPLYQFEGRTEKIPVYQARVPPDWIFILPKDSSYLHDTMQPIAAFNIGKEPDQIRLAIHNFPVNTIEERVPPLLQTTRWQRQFEKLDKASLATANVSQGGFSGIFFEASGEIKGKKAAMLGWAMQIAPEHFNALSFIPSKEKEYREMRADFTIKAVGPIKSILLRKKEISSFAQSFELIQEIPQRT